MIARTQHHLFQPLLYQVATGILSEGEIAPATRRILRNQRNAEVLLGDVVEINLAGHYVVSELLGWRYQTAYDSLVVAAGTGQSYFGNDHFAEFAPGMKTIDDALEVRGRILGAFDLAERCSDPTLREKLLTFTVIGAGPTGVELAGQIAELAAQTLKDAFRHIDSPQARVILLDAGTAVLSPMGAKLGKKAQARLEKLGDEIQLGAAVVDVDNDGLTVKDSDGTTRRIESACKVWSAGVSASPLGIQITEQAGTEVDRAGRVKVLPDLTVAAIRTCSSSVTWPRSHAFQAWRRAPFKARSTPRGPSGRSSRPPPRPCANRSTTRHANHSTILTRAPWPRFRAFQLSSRSVRWSWLASSHGWGGYCCTWSISSDSKAR